MNVIDGEGVVGLTGGGSGWFGGSPSTTHLCNRDGGRQKTPIVFGLHYTCNMSLVDMRA